MNLCIVRLISCAAAVLTAVGGGVPRGSLAETDTSARASGEGTAADAPAVELTCYFRDVELLKGRPSVMVLEIQNRGKDTIRVFDIPTYKKFSTVRPGLKPGPPARRRVQLPHLPEGHYRPIVVIQAPPEDKGEHIGVRGPKTEHVLEIKPGEVRFVKLVIPGMAMAFEGEYRIGAILTNYMEDIASTSLTPLPCRTPAPKDKE